MQSGGQPNNTNGTKNKPWSEAITKFGTQNPNQRDKVIEKLYGMAVAGDMAAIKEIIDRTDGKAIQGMEIEVTHEPKVISSEPMLLEAWEDKASNEPVTIDNTAVNDR